MLVIEGKTKKNREQIMKKAKSFFGRGGSDLALTAEESLRISFEGGGGFVAVKIMEDGAKKNRVEVVTREWEYQAKQFLGKL
jgi:hypothetical protein